MANILSSSIGKKVIMSLSGLFLITFLLLHMSVNLSLLAGSDAYNIACNFMATNPLIRIMEPVLGIGLIIHILLAFAITLRNMKARPVGYKVKNESNNSAWASRNMLVLGSLVLLFLAIHIANFWIKMKTGNLGSTVVDGVEMHDAYTLVSESFKIWWFDLIYIASFLLLGFHLTHGFWSSFQSLGLSNSIWFKRLKAIGTIYTVIVVAGFTIVPLFFLLQ